MAKELFLDSYGNPFNLTPSQTVLFETIFKRTHPRNHIMTYTQFGKSDTTSMATLCRASIYPEKWTIIGPTKEKAKIIMSYVIQHCFDNAFFLDRLVIKQDESLEQIRRERSKNKLTFKIGPSKFGEILILSAQSNRKSELSTSLMGFGSPNVIEDESALVSDLSHATVMRMLGGHKDNYLLKIGNPMARNHFLRSYEDDSYNKFIVKWQQGVQEGRISQSFIDEMRKEPLFSILYDCEFPAADAIDMKGFVPLLTEEEIRLAMREGGQHFGEEKIAVDPSDGGGDVAAIIKKSTGFAEILFASETIDVMQLTGQALLLANDIKSPKKKVFVDKIGVGAGVFRRMLEVNAQYSNALSVYGVNAGEASSDPACYNKRAEMFWKLRKWIKGGGMLSQDERWLELKHIKYKPDSSGKIIIKSKDDMRKEGIRSPGFADALALTFYDHDIVNAPTPQEMFFYKKILKEKKKKDRSRKYNLSAI